MRISRDTFSPYKNYLHVVHQLGSPPVDNELNESQSISAMQLSENVRSPLSALRTTDMGSLRFPYAAGDEWKITATAPESDDLLVLAGAMHVDGFRVVAETDTALSAYGVTFTPVGGADVYGFVYADLALEETDSAADPEIATPNVGETSVRKRLSFTFGKTEGVDFETAFNALTPVPGGGLGLWNGDPGRVFLCRYVRPAGSTNLTNDMLVDLRANYPVRGQTFAKTLRSSGGVGEGAGDSDGMIVWSLADNLLQIGLDNGATTDEAMHTGLLFKAGKGADHHVAHTTHAAWKHYGAGNTDGTPRGPDPNFGWTINDGQALGYVAEGYYPIGDPAVLTTSVVSKDGSAVYDYEDPPVGYTPNPLLVQKLVVQDYADFSEDPSTFVLCYRRGNDLIWWNGQVTRGDANLPVFEEIGASPSVYNAVVGNNGANHLSGADAVERALYYGMSDYVAETLGTSRTLRFHVRRGVYSFARGIKRFGKASELAAHDPLWSATNSRIEMHGDGPEMTKLLFSNPEAASRSDSDIAVCRMVAHTVVLDGLTFNQEHDSTFAGSYVLEIVAHRVEIKNCHFIGPVKITSNNVTIDDRTRFEPLTNRATYAQFASTIAAAPIVAQQLYLAPHDTSRRGLWTITDCFFAPTNDSGTHASVVLELLAAQLQRVNFHGNIIEHDDRRDCPQSGIHVYGMFGFVEIHGNTFSGAGGTVKPGNLAAEVPPFDDNYGGCPLTRYSATQITAPAYVSVPQGRAPNSSLNVHDNNFDLSLVASNLTGRYVMWGACLCVFNEETSQQLGGAHFANVLFTNNLLVMGLATATWGTGAVEPAMYGFYLAPTFQNGQGLSDVVVHNIQVSGNRFDIGGESVGVAQKTWRSIAARNMNSWPGSGGFLTDQTCLIGVQLKNATVGGNAHTGRWATGVIVSGNVIGQQENSGSVGPVYNAVTCNDDGVYGSWMLHAILLDAGHEATNGSGIAVDVSADPVYPEGCTSPANAGCFMQPQVIGNKIELPYFKTTVSTTFGISAIQMNGAYEGLVSTNNIFMSASAVAPPNPVTNSYTIGVNLRGNHSTLVTGNIIKAYYGVRATSDDLAAANLFRGCSSPVTSAVTAYDTDDNFIA